MLTMDSFTTSFWKWIIVQKYIFNINQWNKIINIEASDILPPSDWEMLRNKFWHNWRNLPIGPISTDILISQNTIALEHLNSSLELTEIIFLETKNMFQPVGGWWMTFYRCTQWINIWLTDPISTLILSDISRFYIQNILNILLFIASASPTSIIICQSRSPLFSPSLLP